MLRKLCAVDVRTQPEGTLPGAQFNSIKNGPKTAPKMAPKWNFEKGHMSQLKRVKKQKGPENAPKKAPKEGPEN